MTCKPNVAALAALSLLAACGSNDNNNHNNNHNNGNHPPAAQPRYQATIQRTSYGIPHIEAKDEAGLGFGIGYAYAEDNACLLASEIATVNGDRSRHFGPDLASSENPDFAVNNLDSDFFFRQWNDDAIVQEAWQAQPAEVQALMRGYAAGFNHYLAERGVAGLPQACRNGSWVRPMTELDLIRLMRRTGMTAMGWIGHIGATQPPGQGSTPAPAAARTRQPARLPPPRLTASNAVAIGREASADGGGMLLGQPHLPWGDAQRFYQLHLTIPGKMDVMGATLPGLPAVGIGFTRDFAWTHTTDTSAHATVYALQLDRQDPTRYIVDGQSRPMLRRTITVPVKNPDGSMGTRSRTLYSTEDGPLFSHPEGLAWTSTTAYVLRDANAVNHRVVAQWYRMNLSKSLAELKDANLRLAGNPWNNTIAADRAGNTLMMNVSPIANLPDDALAGCVVPELAELAKAGLYVLDGSRAACAWRNEPGAPQPGTVPASRLPVLERRDYVHNANDSAWLSNPAAPLAGFPALVSRDSEEQGARTRLALSELAARLGKGKLTPADLQEMALDNKVYLAPLLLPDLLAWCGTAGATAELATGCAGLAAWTGDAGLDAGVGLPYFTATMLDTLATPGAWSVPFDPDDPVHTPRGLNYRDPAIAQQLADSLAGVVGLFESAGIPADARLRDFQVSRRGGPAVPIHGGEGALGIFNTIDVVAEPHDGRFEVRGGTTYVQVVGFGADGPRAQALLAYSQSADPASPHHADQTQRFSRGEWITLPFTAAEIAADPALKKRVIVSN
ncbi:penicillin acylase family protein [Pseudoduganella sp. SL102]|uniref:penicillin acylase family protein n=1 Tax=Pseudoduganella sp. SL102 TaxID=2995154 RepID=UPI00248D2C0A|nr:penicillin acylase family protein [Pseudoduganella sp. SL102]WBS02475.1 penicillin acylase family protein [Pseudoduganella sp. SL102]